MDIFYSKCSFEYYKIFIVLINIIAIDVEANTCNLGSKPVLPPFEKANLTSFGNIYQPFTHYTYIYLGQLEVTSIPDFLFANICADFIILSNNKLVNFSINSFAGLIFSKNLLLDRNQITTISNLIQSLHFNTLNMMDLSYNKIQQLTDQFPFNFASLSSLILSFNEIEFIAENVFSNLIHLEVLSLSFNRLKYLSNSTFSNLVSLVNLDLGNNYLEEITNEPFNSLTNLEQINLARNNLQIIYYDFSSYTKNLKQIDISWNKITKIKFDVFTNLVNLSLLKLDNNFFNLSSISFKGLFNLKQLDISQMYLGSFDKQTFEDAKHLKTLNAVQSKLETLGTNTFNKLNELKEIQLAGNKLKSLSNETFNGLGSLKILNLEFNILSKLESFIFKPLRSLNQLSLENNLLTEIEEGLFLELKNLQNLYLTANLIKRLKSGFLKGLSHLDQIEFSDNLIEEIEPNAFLNLAGLTKINLSFNRLRIVKSFYFVGLSSLRHLNLKANGINYIQKNSFQDLINLEDIDLSDNFFVKLDSLAFQNVKISYLNLTKTQYDILDSSVFFNSNIGILILEHNLLESLDSGSFNSLTSTTEIYLGTNKLKNISNELFSSDETSRLSRLLLNDNLLTDMMFLRAEYFQNLNHLDISFNSIEILLVEHFEYLTNLTSLVIRNNPIKHIDVGIFYGKSYHLLNAVSISAPLNLTGVRVLSLDLSRTRHVDLRFLKQQNDLIELFLVDTDLNFTEIDFSNLSKLEKLDLSLNLDDGNFTFSNLTFLKFLTLSQMKINSIDRFSFSNFNHLANLNLSHNLIETIQKENLNSLLLSLDLSFNRIVWIESRAFEDMIWLNKIYLTGNRIRQLTMYVDAELVLIDLGHNLFLKRFEIYQTNNDYLKYIYSVDLSENSLENIDFAYTMDPECLLYELNLSGNLIKNISNKAFPNFSQLKTLFLQSNLIESIELAAFRNQDELMHLNLANNTIRTLDQDVFSSLLQLNYLNISHNFIEFISSQHFSELINLITLDLSYNRLKIIEDYAFKEQNLLKDVYLNENPFFSIFENSFTGLDSLANLYISFCLLKDESNKQIMFNSLKAQLEKPINNVVYFKSINILYDFDKEPEVDCYLVINFSRKNILINLKNDYSLAVFLSYCLDKNYLEDINQADQ